MIENRHIADDANIAGHKIAKNVSPGAKDIYVGTDGTAAYEAAVGVVPADNLTTTINNGTVLATASRGDRVFILPGHVEDLGDTTTTGALDFSKAGVSYIGLGSGSLRPRIDFNDEDSDCLVSANNVTLENIRFEATVTAVKLGVAIAAAVTGTTINGCHFTVETSATDEFLIGVNVLAGCTDTVMKNCFMDMGLGGAASGISFVGASTGCKVLDNEIVGDYSTACVNNDTTLLTSYRIIGNLLVNGNANALGAVACIVIVTNSLGIIANNTMFADVATHLLICTADTTLYSNNLCSDDSGTGSTTALTSASIVASSDA
ncbi:MAG: hypothetical protein KAV87_28125 [Desulfobacteraceae bacterium]|nr:hypothetical protein [Desulfobacteraceae bacterium]